MQIGDVLGDRFDIERLAGSGGMGDVYLARDRMTGQPVALKVLNRVEEDFLVRFEREGRILSQIEHPYVVHYVAHGVSRTGEPWIAMEWLDGEDLAARLSRERLRREDALTVVRCVADAIGSLHARGLVHRDIKPGNIFLLHGRFDQCRLLDLGIIRNTVSTRLTETGVLLGTVAYMAPEQARGESNVDARADVFALGCVLFECLTGSPPFGSNNAMAILTRILFENAPRLSSRLPHVHPQLDEFVASMLSKRAAERPPHGGAVAQALRELLALTDIDASASVSPNTSRPTALTSQERTTVALILIEQPRITEVERLGHSTTLAAGSDSGIYKEVERFGGQLEQLLDGSIAILLKTTSVATDLAAQAARCALALRRHALGKTIAVALGRGDVSTARKQPMGVTIERAAELVTAKPNAELRPHATPIVVDRACAGLLDGRFDVREIDSIFFLVEEHPLAQGTRMLLGKVPPCVGRERDLRMLEQLFDECVGDEVPQAVLLTAPAGVGKSCLAHEFMKSVRHREEGVFIWMGRADSLQAGSALGALGSVLRDALGLRQADALDEPPPRFAAALSDVVPESDHRRLCNFMGEIVGVPSADDNHVQLQAARNDAQLMGEQMLAAFIDFLRHASARHPVLIVLDDLHWGDRPTTHYLDTALRCLDHAPLFILGIARPEVHDVFPHLWSDRNVHEMRLRGLNRRAIERLVHHALGDQVEADVLERLATVSEGNAFYLEELIRTAADARREAWPESLVAMVQSRLNAFNDESRRTLRAASIFGETFSAQAVCALLDNHDVADMRMRLDLFVEREILVKRDSSRFSDAYAFRHALLREGAYSMLTHEDRTLGHRLAGQWLEKHGESDSLLLAEHAAKGGDCPRALHFPLVHSPMSAVSRGGF